MIKLTVCLSVAFSKPDKPDDAVNVSMFQNEIRNETAGLSGLLLSGLLTGVAMTYNTLYNFQYVNDRGQIIDEEGHFAPKEGLRILSTKLGLPVNTFTHETFVEIMKFCGISNVEDHCERGVKILKCFNTLLKK